MIKRRTSSAARKPGADVGSADAGMHEQMIPVMHLDGRWELVQGGPASGDIFENPFATFDEWRVKEGEAFDKP